MAIKATLRAKLLSISEVSDNLTTFYSVPVPRTAVLPYGTLQRVSGTRINTLGGMTGAAREMWQVDVYAESNDLAETVMQAIILEIGAVDHVTWSGTTIHLCVLDDNREMAVDPESFVSRKSADFVVVYDV